MIKKFQFDIQADVQQQKQVNGQLSRQLESLHSNTRQACLIFACREFELRHHNEDVEQGLVNILLKHIPGLCIFTIAVSVAHCLENSDKLIY